MKTATETRSGKGHRDENFPVASHLISPRFRAPIMAFYNFVRAADDVADNPALSPDEKVAMLDGLEAALTGTGPSDPEAEPLRREIAARSLSPRHAIDLLDAFRQDARKNRTADWPDLIAYCSLSAMPVGRFVLDVHGEDRSTWPANDALCAALQVINHVQDCGEDYRNLDRIYLPADIMARHGAVAEDLGAARASPALLATIREVNARTADLLAESASFMGLIADRRLGLEVAVIQTLAESLVGLLRARDPLSERVHATKLSALGIAVGGIMRGLWARGRRPGTTPRKALS